MITVKKLETLEDFEGLKKGDSVAVEWKRDVRKDKRGDKRTRFAVYEVADNLAHMTEIILEKKMNVYFNYTMFLNPEKHGVSNVREIVLLGSDTPNQT